MKINPCLEHNNKINVKNTRDTLFCGCAVLVGKGPNQRAHMHATAGISIATPETPDMIDPDRLARELEVDMCAVNRGRIWTIDEMDITVGEIVNFHGVKLANIGHMIARDLFAQFQNAYVPALIYRKTNWIFYAGKPVHILRQPDGPTWVMQEYTKAMDPTLTIDNLDQVGSKLKQLPEGWTFETKILTENLSLDTCRSDCWASIIRDELGCTYQACGYDTDTCSNYVP